MFRHLFKPDPARPFQLVKFLSWSSLVLILASILALSVFIANYARETILNKNHEFALLLAENLNHQIYQRFTLPTVLGFGRIELRQPAQYERLEQVIRSTTHSFHVLEVRIYDHQGAISYSTNSDLVGQTDLADISVKNAFEHGQYSFKLQKKISNWMAMLRFSLEPDSIVLRTVYPLRVERTLGLREETIMGILEFTQDITADYETVIHFQWLIIIGSFTTSLVLFFMLYMIILRTDRVLAQRISEKERLEKELHQNEKLASMGRMVASIAHEIRNPLGIIRSSSEILHGRAKREGSPNARLLEAIFDESKRLSQIVNDFLDYARPKQPRMEQVDLVRVWEEIFSFLASEVEKHNVSLEKDFPEQLVVSGDKDLLYRAFYNIFVNALQSVPDNGTIRVEMNPGPDPEVTVSDSGPGFEPSMLDKYLEPFYTTKDTGTGLGLAIVGSIIKNHGARIVLSNNDSGGGRVRVIFPVAT
ncbi:ATP-binding protein [Desulfonatronovibrio hydrogenovorans]|uniref:ATP-binding protein n=1 Tax=Desulfonatronovibrio hydrogenovorans TaxID=53245 RepID=UPI00048C565E|nr:ATP-binding protein [Desulfonatronovibrio hydrogenovorans]